MRSLKEERKAIHKEMYPQSASEREREREK